MNEYETSLVHVAMITTVRITPRDADGNPNHPWAYTEPLCLATARRSRVEEIGLVNRSNLIPTSSTFTGAFISDPETDDYDNIQALAYALWQRWRNGAAVEAWAEIEPGTWMHILIPAWYSDADTDQWTVELDDPHEVYAVGKIRTVETYPWPDPCPLPGTPVITPRTHYLMGVTPVPPPAPGYTNVLTTNTVKGTPA